MILKPFKVHSPDSKTFYEGDALLAASPVAPAQSGEINQCDGCRVKAPLTERGIHRYSDGSLIGCTANRYAAQRPDHGGAIEQISTVDIDPECARAVDEHFFDLVASAQADSAPIATEPAEQLIADESDGAWAAFEKSPNAEMSNRDDLWQIWHEAWVAARSTEATPIAPTADAKPVAWIHHNALAGVNAYGYADTRIYAQPHTQFYDAVYAGKVTAGAEPVAWFRKTDITELTDSEPETDGWTPLYAAEKVTADAGSVPQFDYQRTFNAIADAVDNNGGVIGISVAKFVKSFNAASPNPSAVEQTASDTVDVRASVLEEAAKACDQRGHNTNKAHYLRRESQYCADAIRALKDKS